MGAEIENTTTAFESLSTGAAAEVDSNSTSESIALEETGLTERLQTNAALFTVRNQDQDFESFSSPSGQFRFDRAQSKRIVIESNASFKETHAALASINEERRISFIVQGGNQADFTGITPSLFLDEDYLLSIGLGNIATLGLSGNAIESLIFKGKEAVALNRIAIENGYKAVLGIVEINSQHGKYAVFLQNGEQNYVAQEFTLDCNEKTLSKLKQKLKATISNG